VSEIPQSDAGRVSPRAQRDEGGADRRGMKHRQ
jgi:hypothetical protein